MSSFFIRFFSYLGRPFLVNADKKIQKPLLALLRLVIICLIAGIGARFCSEMLVARGIIPAPGPSILDHKEMSPFGFFLGAVFIAPVLEELVFRAQLKRFTGGIFFISFICGTILSAVTKTYWAFLISPFMFGPLFIIYRFTLAGSVTRKFRFWKRIFPWQFYFTAICFALVHLGNFEKGIALLPFGLLYTLPQLVLGLILGYTRMFYGLKYSIALHSIYNLSLTILLFLAH